MFASVSCLSSTLRGASEYWSVIDTQLSDRRSTHKWRANGVASNEATSRMGTMT
jgi:hypothetical protein